MIDWEKFKELVDKTDKEWQAAVVLTKAEAVEVLKLSTAFDKTASLENDLADALDLKKRTGPTVLTVLATERDELKAKLQAAEKHIEIVDASNQEQAREIARLLNRNTEAK